MDDCVKIREKRQPKGSGLLRGMLQQVRGYPTQNPLISPFDSAPQSLQQLTEQIVVINCAVGNTSIGIRVPLHKFRRGTVCFSAASCEMCVITRQKLSISSLGWTLAFIPETLPCFVPPFGFHFAALQQFENELIYKSKHRCLHSRY